MISLYIGDDNFIYVPEGTPLKPYRVYNIHNELVGNVEDYAPNLSNKYGIITIKDAAGFSLKFPCLWLNFHSLFCSKEIVD